ncbi:hypothetical protein AgCh_030495 [Apium graveolens]
MHIHYLNKPSSDSFKSPSPGLQPSLTSKDFDYSDYLSMSYGASQLSGKANGVIRSSNYSEGDNNSGSSFDFRQKTMEGVCNHFFGLSAHQSQGLKHG